jgi:hypothetical protein
MARRDPEPEPEVDVELLPHWARVAFAARCARRVFPLFGRSWPGAEARRSAGILQAIELAERSAAAGAPVDGLERAIIEATTSAGAALSSVYGFASDEAAPADKDLATVATFVANAAGRAAEAARAVGDSSNARALDAVDFAQTAARTAPALAILVDIESDFATLYRAVHRRRWTDKTAVPPTVFEVS